MISYRKLIELSGMVIFRNGYSEPILRAYDLIGEEIVEVEFYTKSGKYLYSPQIVQGYDFKYTIPCFYKKDDHLDSYILTDKILEIKFLLEEQK